MAYLLSSSSLPFGVQRAHCPNCPIYDVPAPKTITPWFPQEWCLDSSPPRLKLLQDNLWAEPAQLHFTIQVRWLVVTQLPLGSFNPKPVFFRKARFRFRFFGVRRKNQNSSWFPFYTQLCELKDLFSFSNLPGQDREHALPRGNAW